MREAPKARLYTSLGQRPRSPAQNRAGLKARLISPSVAGKTGMRPTTHQNLKFVEPISMENKHPSQLRFLVVEDQEFQRDALVMLLDSIGAREVLQAEHGQSALDLLNMRTSPVDIILSDIDMPGMDGMAFLRALAETDSPASIILVSGLNPAVLHAVETMAKAYGLKLLGIMPKPPSRGTLLALIAGHDARPQRRQASANAPVLPEEIDAALANGEFIPYFQPKVAMANGRVVGVEALVRWQSPSRGLLPPGAFLEAVETGGFMDPLTWVMLARSAAVCRRWREQGLALTVSVNLSLSSLARLALADHVLQVVTEQGLSPDAMILEVTETAAMTDVGHSIENLVRLRLRGFGLSIDDYGTGYSSMQQLTRGPFTEVKVDQSFVRAADHQDSVRIVVESTLDITRKLGLHSSAEGIETEAHWDMLKGMGCDIAQGYWIARPMPEAAVADWVAGWEATFKQPSPMPLPQVVNILLVEDEDFQRETYGDLLEQFGLGQVQTVQDVDGAIKRLAEFSYDLVITDVNLMNGPSGLDLAKLIRTGQTPASPAIRIIVLTAHEGDQDLVLGSIALDINGLLAKPVPARSLHRAILYAMKEEFAPRPTADYRNLTAESAATPEGVDAISPSKVRREQAAPLAAGVLVPLTALKTGMTLAEAIYTQDRFLVLPQGYTLTPSIIHRLQDVQGVLASSEIRVNPPSA